MNVGNNFLERNKMKVMPNSNEDKITNYVTKAVAEEWSIDAEQTLFFVEVLAQLDINLTLRNSPDSFDALQNHFETICETTLLT